MNDPNEWLDESADRALGAVIRFLLVVAVSALAAAVVMLARAVA